MLACACIATYISQPGSPLPTVHTYCSCLERHLFLLETIWRGTTWQCKMFITHDSRKDRLICPTITSVWEQKSVEERNFRILSKATRLDLPRSQAEHSER
jgi:hypothetical protein